MMRLFPNRRSGTGGYGDILRLAFPLILSHGSWTIQQIVDRIFLTWYSPEAVAAAMPAGMMNWTIVSLFTGTAGYISAFTAQYHGAKWDGKIGPLVWQVLFFRCLRECAFCRCCRCHPRFSAASATSPSCR